jgi:predicted porin
MKLPQLLFLALAPLASPAALAQSTVTIYGRIDLSLDNTKTGPTSLNQQRDNASRLGFRGTEDLGSGLKAAFGLEMGISADTGTTTSPPYRNSYVGLIGRYGAVALGRLDSSNPTKSPIYSLITEHTDFVIHDAGATAIGTRVLNARNRTSNAVGYISPDLGGVTFMARGYLNGFDAPTSAGGPVRSEWDIKQLDMGVSYKAGGFGMGVGFGKDKKTGGLVTGNFDKKAMIVAGYDFGSISAYGLFGRDKYVASATARRDVDFWLVGASADIGLSQVVANYMERDVRTDRNGTLKKFQIGYGYRLSKRTMVYALYDRDDPNSNAGNDVIRNYSVGVRHQF